MICFENVSKKFDDGTIALNNLNFEIPMGQVCTILGPSGSGKSTLLRLIIGLCEPTSGLIKIDGEISGKKNIKKIRENIGMIHQSFGLVARSSVAQNILNGALPKVSTLNAIFGFFSKSMKARAAINLSQTGLEELHLLRRVSELSGGQQQRVGIARAFMLEPKIILADEPVASLDPKISEDIMDLIIRQSRARNAAVLCSLHQIELARKYSDRIIALNAGQIVFDGTPSQLSPKILHEIYGVKSGELSLELAENKKTIIA